MNLKRKIAASAAALLLIGSAMNVSAAELSSKDYVNTLIKNDQAELIIDVDAYKAAYSDLAQAFGDDTDAYINHYLTIGVYEGRTKGVLFDPLVYANAYSDVKNALGYDIAAIVQHYLSFGIAENRTQGTAHGYADIAAAEKAGVQSTNVNRVVSSAGSGDPASSDLVSSADDTGDSSANNNDTAGNVSSGGQSAVGNASSGNDSFAGNNAGSSNVAFANNSPAVSNDTAGSSSSSENRVPAADNSSTEPVSAGNASAGTEKGYDHTTSIYDNDEKTLLRVEYYDENGKMLQYSDVTYSDSSSNSYTENIYHYDEETDTEILDRTDVYENGSLVSSVNQ